MKDGEEEDSRYILKTDPTHFPRGLSTQGDYKGGNKNDPESSEPGRW